MTMHEPISGQSGVGHHLKKFATKMQIVNNVRLTYRHMFVATCRNVVCVHYELITSDM
jgi:hypothetical protein